MLCYGNHLGFLIHKKNCKGLSNDSSYTVWVWSWQSYLILFPQCSMIKIYHVMATILDFRATHLTGGHPRSMPVYRLVIHKLFTFQSFSHKPLDQTEPILANGAAIYMIFVPFETSTWQLCPNLVWISFMFI
jgi:hypothetical protein